MNRLASRQVALALTALAAISLLGPLPGANALGGIPVPTPPVGPPTYTVNVDEPSGAVGDIFYTTGFSAAAVGIDIPAISAAVAPLEPSNLVIADKSGKVIWKRTAGKGLGVADFRTQIYHGEKVLTWWEGTDQGGHGAGTDYIADSHYKIIKKIALPASTGDHADIHEFRLENDGREALITSYKPITHDLTSIGGPKNAKMNDAIAFVVDTATGKVLHQWSALAHIPLTNTRVRRPLPGSTTYDPYHINSIALDPQGNLVISFRDLSAIYDVDINSGRINWVLGGAHPTLKAGPGVEFGFQHDAEFISPTTLQFFNDNALGQNDPKSPLKLVGGLSSVEQVTIDAKDHTATLVHNWTHPDDLVSVAMGNAQHLADGHTFVSWGAAPRISEFDANGKLVYDASLPTPSYRAFLDTWPGN
ncbi:MAG: arylsulfotransferase family protein [Marmoricola sp.]|nr:arylsulfotransferase family protein [Marmoricola sp.]